MLSKATIANTLWTTSNVPAYLRFRRALREPHLAQRRKLRDLITQNTNTAFGKAHGFDEIRSYEDFTRRVPLSDYTTIEPWIDRIRCGEKNVLTQDPVTHLIPTSGSTGARKLIPFTAGLQREFNAALGPWLVDLIRQHPGLIGGPAYWSITPAINEHATESSPVPIGFASDTEYLGGNRRRLADAIMAVPPDVGSAKSLDAVRYETLLHLVRCRELRLISVWHPSFLTLLLDSLPALWERLLNEIECGGNSDEVGRASPRADITAQSISQQRLAGTLAPPSSISEFPPDKHRVDELRHADPRKPQTIWPRLQVISCWGDGAAAFALEDLRRRFPVVSIQPKGLLATEAFVTFPLANHHPLAVTSHFFEFIDSQGAVVPAEEVYEGEEYEIVVTTAGGLWRYQLGDRVRVTGWLEKTPSLKFLGRNGNVSDLFGEKLSEPFVALALAEVFGNKSPRFALLAPDRSPSPWGEGDRDVYQPMVHGKGRCYTLYMEGQPESNWADVLDRALRQNPHYAYCRDLAQLLPPRIFLIAGRGFESYAAHQAANGARLGDIKPALLSRTTGWSNVFPGAYFRPLIETDYTLNVAPS